MKEEPPTLNAAIAQLEYEKQELRNVLALLKTPAVRAFEREIPPSVDATRSDKRLTYHDRFTQYSAQTNRMSDLAVATTVELKKGTLNRIDQLKKQTCNLQRWSSSSAFDELVSAKIISKSEAKGFRRKISELSEISCQYSVEMDTNDKLLPLEVVERAWTAIPEYKKILLQCACTEDCVRQLADKLQKLQTRDVKAKPAAPDWVKEFKPKGNPSRSTQIHSTTVPRRIERSMLVKYGGAWLKELTDVCWSVDTERHVLELKTKSKEEEKVDSLLYVDVIDMPNEGDLFCMMIEVACNQETKVIYLGTRSSEDKNAFMTAISHSLGLTLLSPPKMTCMDSLVGRSSSYSLRKATDDDEVSSFIWRTHTWSQLFAHQPSATPDSDEFRSFIKLAEKVEGFVGDRDLRNVCKALRGVEMLFNPLNIETRVGTKIKILSLTKTWRVCTIVKSDSTRIKIHYEGYEDIHDEWLATDSDRIEAKGGVDTAEAGGLNQVRKLCKKATAMSNGGRVLIVGQLSRSRESRSREVQCLYILERIDRDWYHFVVCNSSSKTLTKYHPRNYEHDYSRANARFKACLRFRVPKERMCDVGVWWALVNVRLGHFKDSTLFLYEVLLPHLAGCPLEEAFDQDFLSEQPGQELRPLSKSGCLPLCVSYLLSSASGSSPEVCGLKFKTYCFQTAVDQCKRLLKQSGVLWDSDARILEEACRTVASDVIKINDESLRSACLNSIHEVQDLLKKLPWQLGKPAAWAVADKTGESASSTVVSSTVKFCAFEGFDLVAEHRSSERYAWGKMPIVEQEEGSGVREAAQPGETKKQTENKLDEKWKVIMKNIANCERHCKGMSSASAPQMLCVIVEEAFCTSCDGDPVHIPQPKSRHWDAKKRTFTFRRNSEDQDTWEKLDQASDFDQLSALRQLLSIMQHYSAAVASCAQSGKSIFDCAGEAKEIITLVSLSYLILTSLEKMK
jgi:hypothetical protein